MRSMCSRISITLWPRSPSRWRRRTSTSLPVRRSPPPVLSAPSPQRSAPRPPLPPPRSGEALRPRSEEA